MPRFSVHKETFYIPEAEDCLLSKSGEAGADTKNEGKDSEGCVDRHQGGTEASSSLIADQQQQEAEETDSVLRKILRKIVRNELIFFFATNFFNSLLFGRYDRP